MEERIHEIVAERFEDFTHGDRGIGPKLREKLHEELDQALARYEAGDPMWIVQELSWSSSKQASTVRIVISEQVP